MKTMFKRVISSILVVASILLLVLPSVTLPAKALSYSGSSSYKSGKYYSQLTNIALTGNQRKDIVDVAQSQIGYQEGGSSSQLSGTVKGSGNYTEYGRWYGMQDMWCAMFVSWCAYVAGIPTSVVPSHAYTPTGLNWFIDRGRAYSRATVANGGYTPQPGDIIYFKSSRNQNITNHVGIVTSYSNGTVYTVEGNTSSATISTNGGAVAAKSYSISNTYIVYICSPNYTAPVVEETPAVDPWRDVVFDAGFYASKYSDARESCGSDFDALYNHYKTVGVPEGRQGSPNFDVKYYLDHIIAAKNCVIVITNEANSGSGIISLTNIKSTYISNTANAEMLAMDEVEETGETYVYMTRNAAVAVLDYLNGTADNDTPDVDDNTGTNTPDQTEPSVPDTDEPDQTEPSVPDADEPDQDVPGIPETGDSMEHYLYGMMLLMLACVAAIAVVTIFSNRRYAAARKERT